MLMSFNHRQQRQGLALLEPLLLLLLLLLGTLGLLQS
jgi:Tfp pilus assembly protein PilV